MLAVSPHFVKSNCLADTIKVRAAVELTRHLGWLLHLRGTGWLADVWWCFCKCSVWKCLLLLLSCEFSWTSGLGLEPYDHVHCNNRTVMFMYIHCMHSKLNAYLPLEWEHTFYNTTELHHKIETNCQKDKLRALPWCSSGHAWECLWGMPCLEVI